MWLPQKNTHKTHTHPCLCRSLHRRLLELQRPTKLHKRSGLPTPAPPTFGVVFLRRGGGTFRHLRSSARRRTNMHSSSCRETMQASHNAMFILAQASNDTAAYHTHTHTQTQPTNYTFHENNGSTSGAARVPASRKGRTGPSGPTRGVTRGHSVRGQRSPQAPLSTFMTLFKVRMAPAEECSHQKQLL